MEVGGGEGEEADGRDPALAADGRTWEERSSRGKEHKIHRLQPSRKQLRSNKEPTKIMEEQYNTISRPAFLTYWVDGDHASLLEHGRHDLGRRAPLASICRHPEDGAEDREDPLLKQVGRGRLAPQGVHEEVVEGGEGRVGREAWVGGRGGREGQSLVRGRDADSPRQTGAKEGVVRPRGVKRRALGKGRDAVSRGAERESRGPEAPLNRSPAEWYSFSWATRARYGSSGSRGGPWESPKTSSRSKSVRAGLLEGFGRRKLSGIALPSMSSFKASLRLASSWSAGSRSRESRPMTAFLGRIRGRK